MSQQAPAVPLHTCFKVFVIIILFLLIGCLFAFIFRSERSVSLRWRLISKGAAEGTAERWAGQQQ